MLVSGNQNDQTFPKIRLLGVTAWSGTPLGCDRQFPHFSIAQPSAITCIFGLLVPTETEEGNLSPRCLHRQSSCIFCVLFWLPSVGLYLPGGLGHSLEVCGAPGLQPVFPLATASGQLSVPCSPRRMLPVLAAVEARLLCCLPSRSLCAWQAELHINYVYKIKQHAEMLRGVGQAEITALCLFQCCGGCMRTHGCRELSDTPAPSLLPQVQGSSGQKARAKNARFSICIFICIFFPNLLPLFPSPKAWLAIYRRWSQPDPARESLHIFASWAVSWYMSPWRPWRSDPLHARGSATWRLSRAGSWETLFFHAP